MTLVLDASMALAWLFIRQRPEESDRAEAVLAGCGTEPWMVPVLWHLEITNAVLVAERRGVISQGHGERFLRRLQALPIETDATAISSIRGPIEAIARTHGLTAYDATYLELAQRCSGSLASFDRKLMLAAASLDLNSA